MGTTVLAFVVLAFVALLSLQTHITCQCGQPMRPCKTSCAEICEALDDDTLAYFTKAYAQNTHISHCSGFRGVKQRGFRDGKERTMIRPGTEILAGGTIISRLADDGGWSLQVCRVDAGLLTGDWSLHLS